MANEVEIRITAQDNASAKLREVGSAAQSAGTQAKEAGGHLGRMAEIAGGFVVARGLMQLPNILGSIVGGASDLNESLSKMNVVFGSSAGVIDTFAQSAAKNLGMSRQEATEAAAAFGNLFVTMKLGQPAAAEMSKNILQLASDLASFNNLDPGEVLEKLRSGLVGETEPMRALGVVINEAAVSAKGLAMGLGNVKGELTEAEKVQARYALIMEQTKTAQGDFARTADGMANSQRILKAEISDMAAQLGNALLPAMTGVVGVLSEAVGAFTALDGGSQALILGLTGLAITAPLAIGPIKSVVGLLKDIDENGLGAGAKLGLVAAGIGAITLASDVILQKTTGHGLIEWIFGDPATADRTADAIGRITAKIQALGSGSELRAIADEVSRLTSEFARFGESDQGALAKAFTPGGPAVLFRGEIDAIAQSLKSAGAGMADWQRTMQALSPDLQNILSATTEYKDALGAYINTQTTAAQLMEAQGESDRLMAEAMQKVAKFAPEAKGAIQSYIDSLGTGEQAAKNLEAALGRLADRFSTTNPAVIAAKIELAAISEELDDAAASGRKWSDLFGTSIDALTKRQKDLEAVTKAADSNATAFKGIADQLQKVIGMAGVGALDQAMAGVGKTLEQQVTTIEQIGLAFAKFASNDIPGIEAAFAELKTNLTNQEWAVVGDALAQKFVEGFYQQTTGAGQQRILDAAKKIGVALPGSLGAGLAAAGGGVAQSLEGLIADAYMHIGPIAQAGGVSVGSQMGAGIAAGLVGSTGVVAPAAASLVQAGLDAARRAMRIFSPSRAMAEDVGRPMAQGVAAGIVEAIPEVQAATTLMTMAAWAGSRAAMGVIRGQFDGGSTPNSHPYNPWGQFGASDALGGMTMSGSWGTMPGLGTGNPDLSQFHLTPSDFLRPWAGGDGSVAGSVFSQWRGPAPMSREQYEQDRWQQYGHLDPYAELQLQFMRDSGIADQFGLYQYIGMTPAQAAAKAGKQIGESDHYHDPWALPADWAAQYGFGPSAGGPGPAGGGGGYTTQPIGGITVVINIQGSLVGQGGINELAHAVQDELVKVFY